MKRERLLKTLRNEAKQRGVSFTLARQGGKHEVWAFGDSKVSIPRHRDIAEGTAKGIIDDCTKGT